ncbi:MAG: endonuclease/exonuclease/phosphatase family protein [Sphingomonas sp.]|uniref:endonuclease/exonuclease/phosphatase family protein n=1 Tax=Sphingomonas sp. TaxID=28214 RepID=UPI0017DD2A83|nr:endonuclease/exonuclease/phosphatase family protein [Sphingomonas sp.]MBA3667523.1 endonuclease/exonuclease/phosphatase family protein [Sphingomonas sp.]
MTGWRKLGRLALVAMVVALVVLSVLPAWQTDRWWVRQWDYPRIQVAALLLITGAALWLVYGMRSRTFQALMIGVVAALAWQVSHFLAYIPPYPKEVASAGTCPTDRQLSLLNANVLLTNKDYPRLLRLVEQRNPDVLLLLEPGAGWAKALAPLAKRYPYRLSEPTPNTYGMILMSRLPTAGQLMHRLQPGVPSAKVKLTLPGGQEVIFHALHPEPPWPGDDSGERDAELVAVGREVRDDGRASIVMGDLNDVAWSRTSRLFKKVAGMRDSRVGRGFYPTFTAEYPLLRWPLDHLFVSPHFEVMAIDVLPNIGSDHFPIFFRLCLTDRAGERQVAPDAPPTTEAEATEEVREGVAETKAETNGQ